MINVSPAYKQACSASERKSYVIAKYGLYDKKAKGEIARVETSSKPFANISKTYNEIKDTNYNYISCEPNRVKLDGSFYFISDKNKPNTNENIAYWSNDLSNSVGKFNVNPKIVYIFNAPIPFIEVTLYFQEVCKAFAVNYYNKEILIATRKITNNNFLKPTTNGNVVMSDTLFDKLEIEFIETKEPYRYIKFNEIDFGTIHQ